MRSIQEELKSAVNKEMRDNGGWQAGCTWEIEVDAAIDAFFASEWEAKEVATWRGPNPHRSEVTRYWAEPESACSKVRHEATTILVPRKKPGLREAAEVVVRSYHEPAGPPLACSIDALAAALKEEDV